ncbi:VOC family protein [Siminovitchia acidinfaciens]|uniref:VOC family protein n=1 Tax=Siminovitchia acidinfaciens TaxID=2321395 RepID=A0A429Y758_9BACI|nr:VOC family protein [Siminovitchia acidinfaciens]RST77222.1 VOC family protein [Siminovitchia acidinfaciens]
MIQKMEHTAIMVHDMERSIEFYCEVLGFKVRLRGRKPDREMAFLYLESQPDMEIELICDVDSVVCYNADGIVNHLAFTVNEIETAIGYLKDKSVEFCSDEIKPTLEGGRMILFWGPSRELLQLVERVNN